jgi:lysophospholipase L1-like esterase
MIKNWPVIAILFMAVLSGCAKKADSLEGTLIDTNSNTIDGSITWIALGDSYTVGQSEPLAVSFPFQLTNYLDGQGLPVKAPVMIATTGCNTYNLLHAIAASPVLNTKYDFVTLLIGVNDQFQGVSEATYSTNFTQCLQSAINFANGDSTRVFVLSIPDYGVTPFGNGMDSTIGPQIDQFNAINKAISLKAGVNYLDITGISREAATDTALIAPDGLHPSGEMYALWVNLLGPMVAARLKLSK